MLKRVINSRLLREENCWFDSAGCQACENECDERIKECEEQISQYEDLKSQIDEKIQAAKDLQATFDLSNRVINRANMNGDFNGMNYQSCTNCITDLISTFDNMKTDCDKEIKDWKAKKTQAEADRGQCAANNTHCD